MAGIINLSDVSTEDDSELKTGGRRKHTMPKDVKGKKLSYKSYSACLESTDTDSGRVACAKYFKKKDYGIKKLSKKESEDKAIYKVKKSKAIAKGAI